MEWICVYHRGQPIANVCLEKVYENLLILSNFYVIPNMRSQGIGRGLLSSIFKDYKAHRWMLFVNRENIGAVALHKKLGFEIRGQVANVDKDRNGI